MSIGEDAAREIAAAKLRIIGRVNPLLESLPDWVANFRVHQRDAVDSTLEAFQHADLVVLDAPTGAGKTLIAETVRRMMRLRAVYSCTTKSLQDQFLHDFPYARVLKGRANYPTLNQPRSFHPDKWGGHISCEDCTWTRDRPVCKFCPSKYDCPYERAKSAALRADVAVLNLSYLLAEANHVGRFTGQELVILDEADTVESALMGHVEVRIGEARLKKLGWDPPEKVTVADSYTEWAANKCAELRVMLRGFPDDFAQNVAANREYRYLSNLHESLRSVVLQRSSDAWVYTGRGVKDPPGKGVSFQPSRVDFLGTSMLWKHSRRWLLMSGTVISAQELVESLGWEKPYELVRVPNTFPVANRKVHVRPAADMSRKAQANGDMGASRLIGAIGHILSVHPPSDRVLIHTVSYDLARLLSEGLLTHPSRPIINYAQAADRDMALARFRSTPGAILIAPSMDRGVDLPQDDCRVVIVAKVPYPYLGNRQVNKRLYSAGGRTWYSVQTVRTIVQMCGRGVRSEEDSCTTYILDSQFQRLWSQARGLFPRWYTDALDWRD